MECHKGLEPCSIEDCDVLVVILSFFHYVRDNAIHQFWSLRSAPGWRWWWRHWAHQNGKGVFNCFTHTQGMMIFDASELAANRVGYVPPSILLSCNKQLSTMNCFAVHFQTKTDQPFKNPSQNLQECWFMLLSRYTSWLKESQQASEAQGCHWPFPGCQWQIKVYRNRVLKMVHVILV